MATKDRKNGNQASDSGSSNDPSQYTNLNLNSLNHENSGINTVHSKSTSSKNGSGNYVSEHNDFNESSKNDSTSWQTSEKRLYPSRSEYLNLHKPQEMEKNKVKDAENSSTLSLHIAAYENSIEDGNQNGKDISDESDAMAKKSKKGKVSRAINGVKKFFTGSSSKESSSNPFSFPEQKTCTPETMKFKSSQKLLDPNKRKNVDPKEFSVKSIPQNSVLSGFQRLLPTLNISKENIISREACGQEVALGELYDARSGTFCGRSVFSNNIDQYVKSNGIQNVINEYTVGNSLNTKFCKHKIYGADMKLNHLSGMIKFDDDSFGSNDNVSTASLFSQFTTKLETIDVSSKSVKKQISLDALKTSSSATHVVIGIAKGVNTIATLKHQNGDNQELMEDALQRALHSLDLNAEDKLTENATQFRFQFDVNDALRLEETFPQTLEEAKPFMKNLPKLIKGKEVPVSYIMIPLTYFKKSFKKMEVCDRIVQKIDENIAQEVVKVFEEIDKHIKSVTKMDKTFSQYEYCLRNEVIQNVRQKLHDLKEFYSELEKQLHQNLMDIRNGRKDSSILNEILHRYRSSRYTPQAMASIYQEFDRYREKIRFVHYLSMNKVACFGRETSVEVERIKNNFHHCFEYYCDWSNVNNLVEASNLFIKLIKNGTQMVFVDLEVNSRARNINVVPEGNRICQYFNGRYTDKDYLQTWKEKQSKCFVTCLGQKKSVPKNISKFVYVKLPCPQSFKDECCGDAECEWYCADCEQRLQYDFKQHFYCRCGIAPVEAYQFHCSDQNHGESYVNFENNDKLFTLIDKIRPYEEVNILLLGETGVGKTTFINSSANAVTFSKLEEAEMSEPICLIPSQFTCTELDNDERVVRKIQIGKSENENFKDGESCTQSPKSHVVIVGNKLIRYIDTPGIGDTRGTTTDKENFASILQYISQFDKIHGICVLLKPNESRLNLVFKYCINELLSHLHVSAASNIVFCFTRARETFYQPGDSWPILKRYVDELYDNRNVKLDLSTKSIYCFDNEAFRFLHLMRNGVKYTDDERAIFEKSWEISVKESQRLLNHFQNDVAPHIVNETVSLNEARRIILTAAQPLADITKNIQKNIRAINRQQTEIQQADAYDIKLRGKLMIKHIGFETEEIDYPRTVCNSSTCTETKQQPNSEVKKVIYKAICHDHCYLENVTPETAPNPALQKCAAMDKNLTCKECGCHWDTHLHIRFIQREVEKEAEDENVRRSIDQNKSDIEVQLDAIKSLEERIDEYEKVQADIDQILAKFASFLKENAILAYNDTVEDYLKLNIRDEKEQIPPNYELLKKMEEQLQRYQEEKRILNSRLESGEIQHVQPGDIKELQKDLENLLLVGKDFKILFDATVNGVKKNLQVGQQQPHDPYNQAAVQKYHPKNRNDNAKEQQPGTFQAIGQSLMSFFG